MWAPLPLLFFPSPRQRTIHNRSKGASSISSTCPRLPQYNGNSGRARSYTLKFLCVLFLWLRRMAFGPLTRLPLLGLRLHRTAPHVSPARPHTAPPDYWLEQPRSKANTPRGDTLGCRTSSSEAPAGRGLPHGAAENWRAVSLGQHVGLLFCKGQVFLQLYAVSDQKIPALGKNNRT